MKRTNKEIRKSHGRVDAKKLASFIDRDVERFACEDDSDTSGLGEPRFVPPRTDVRALRERLGLSQSNIRQTKGIRCREPSMKLTIAHESKGYAGKANDRCLTHPKAGSAEWRVGT